MTYSISNAGFVKFVKIVDTRRHNPTRNCQLQDDLAWTGLSGSVRNRAADRAMWRYGSASRQSLSGKPVCVLRQITQLTPRNRPRDALQRIAIAHRPPGAFIEITVSVEV